MATSNLQILVSAKKIISQCLSVAAQPISPLKCWIKKELALSQTYMGLELFFTRWLWGNLHSLMKTWMSCSIILNQEN